MKPVFDKEALIQYRLEQARAILRDAHMLDAFDARLEGDYRDVPKINEQSARENLLAADAFVSSVERHLRDRKNT